MRTSGRILSLVCAAIILVACGDGAAPSAEEQPYVDALAARLSEQTGYDADTASCVALTQIRQVGVDSLQERLDDPSQVDIAVRHIVWSMESEEQAAEFADALASCGGVGEQVVSWGSFLARQALGPDDISCAGSALDQERATVIASHIAYGRTFFDLTGGAHDIIVAMEGCGITVIRGQ